MAAKPEWKRDIEIDVPSFQWLTSPKPPPDMENILSAPYRHLTGQPGKGLRSVLTAAFNSWLRVPEDKLEKINEIVDMLHTASLMIDDIEDSSKLRRGVPVAHAIFGVPQTINSANYMYFKAMELVQQLGSPVAMTAFLEELLQLHRGQGLELHWRDSNTCPTEEEYQRMVLDKTGGLFRLAVKLMQAFSESRENLLPLVNKLALFYQIRDDYINLKSSSYHDNKGFCEDITEGKFSFPIIHAILQSPSDRRLHGILRQKLTDVDVLKWAVSYIEAAGSFAYCRATLRRIAASTLEDIDRLGGNELLTDLVRNKFCAGIDEAPAGDAK